MYGIGINVLSEGERSENTNLAARVVTLDISCRILLCKAQLLSELESVRELHAVLDHLGENEVGCAVEDTRDLVYDVCDEALVHRADNRNAAADGGLKEKVDVVFLCESEQLGAVRRDKLLVGGDNALARLDTAGNELIGRVKSAHYLYDYADLEVVDDLLKVLCESVRDRAVGELAKVENLLDVDFLAETREQLLLVRQQDFGDARTDNAVSHNSY